MIEGVEIRVIEDHSDSRGLFFEAYRREWMPWMSDIQLNCSQSKKGTIRGLHYHLKQFDYWFLAYGAIKVVLYDLRMRSVTFRKSQVIILDSERPRGILIPPRVGHGYLALTNMSLIYVVDKYYNGLDEYGVAWNSQEIKGLWGIDNPILSERDKSYPTINNRENV